MRQEALRGVVKNEWGVLLADAIAATRSRGLKFAHHKQDALALLDTWRRKEEIRDLALGSSIPIDEPNDLEEILNLLYLRKVFHFFLQKYETKAPRPPWISNDQWTNTILPMKLSEIEKHRFLRALCRLQIYANIFSEYEYTATTPHGSKSNNWGSFKDNFHLYEEGYRLFFGAMPPWEFQEIGCLWGYLTTMFGHIYTEISDGLHDLVEKYMTKDPEYARQFPCFELLPQEVMPPWWNGIDKLSNVELLWKFDHSLASMGPDFVYRVLHGTPLVRRDMVMINGNDFGQFSQFPDMYLSEEWMVPFIYPADRHAVQDYEQLWSILPSIEQPNLGWKQVHVLPDTPGQTFEEAIDIQCPRKSLWCWGYAIFDDERLKAWKAPLTEFRLGNEPEFAV